MTFAWQVDSLKLKGLEHVSDRLRRRPRHLPLGFGGRFEMAPRLVCLESALFSAAWPTNPLDMWPRTPAQAWASWLPNGSRPV